MDNRHPVQEAVSNGSFKEAVCINAERIYDSCSDKDCLEDLKVFFPDAAQAIIDKAVNVRIKKVEILTAYLDLEPVAFNQGFYSVDMTFFFRVWLETVLAPASCPEVVSGVCVFNKKVILYGSEGNVKVFTSEMGSCDDDSIPPRLTSPKAVMQAAEPIGLSARVCEARNCCDTGCCCGIPQKVCCNFEGQFGTCVPQKNVYVTIGLFTIIQIVRDVQILIPAYDFCIPEKECVTSSDNPCELFRRIDFPTNQFFPPKMCEFDDNGCGCK